jgi:predicted small secreted protein
MEVILVLHRTRLAVWLPLLFLLAFVVAGCNGGGGY